MGRFSEALKKLEEERRDQKGIRSESHVQRRKRFKHYLVSLIILVVMIAAAVYGYGLRKGLDLAKTETIPPTPQAIENVEAVTRAQPEAEPAPKPEDALLLSAVEQMVKLNYEEGASTPPASAPSEPLQNFYTIQLANFQDAEAARFVAKDLRAQGYATFVVRSGKYSAVCVEKFANKEEARLRLMELRNSSGGTQHQDAFVRYIKPKTSNE
ncbi:MAG: SPOR domain-containing protein [Candidatus Omnitrophica bacterium]|nr:SPOR domain-containing protein [Candidatus Omnitrophota bacterium]